MTKPAKIFLGVLTIWPVLYIFIFIFTVISMVFTMQEPPDQSSTIPAAFLLIFLLHLLTMFMVVVLLIVYIMNVFKNDRVDKDKKALWAVILFMGNIFAMPVYWYLYIWREPKIAPPQGQ